MRRLTARAKSVQRAGAKSWIIRGHPQPARDPDHVHAVGGRRRHRILTERDAVAAEEDAELAEPSGFGVEAGLKIDETTGAVEIHPVPRPDAVCTPGNAVEVRGGGVTEQESGVAVVVLLLDPQRVAADSKAARPSKVPRPSTRAAKAVEWHPRITKHLDAMLLSIGHDNPVTRESEACHAPELGRVRVRCAPDEGTHDLSLPFRRRHGGRGLVARKQRAYNARPTHYPRLRHSVPPLGIRLTTRTLVRGGS